jgi:hypothetical protein
MEIDKKAKLILAGGQQLAKEIDVAIRDTVVSNAAGIDRYHERREELTEINYQFLFFYAVSLVLYFASSAKSWPEEEVNRVIDGASEEIVRTMRFRTTSESDPESNRIEISGQFRDIFENVRSNFDRLTEISKEDKNSEAIITLIFMYFTKVYPAFITLLSEGNIAVTSELGQRFGLISITAYRYCSD